MLKVIGYAIGEVSGLVRNDARVLANEGLYRTKRMAEFDRNNFTYHRIVPISILKIVAYFKNKNWRRLPSLGKKGPRCYFLDGGKYGKLLKVYPT